MSSRWTHSICAPCWDGRYPDRPSSANLAVGSGDLERCCFCGLEHTSGIYIREDPAGLQCEQGGHE